MDGDVRQEAAGSGKTGEGTTQTMRCLRKNSVKGGGLEVEAALGVAAVGAATRRAQRMAAVESAGDQTLLCRRGGGDVGGAQDKRSALYERHERGDDDVGALQGSHTQVDAVMQFPTII